MKKLSKLTKLSLRSKLATIVREQLMSMARLQRQTIVINFSNFPNFPNFFTFSTFSNFFNFEKQHI